MNMKTTSYSHYIDHRNLKHIDRRNLKRASRNASMLIAALILISTRQASAFYFQSFETDTTGWEGATRVMSGTHGVVSKIGAFHAEDGGDAFTRWGGYSWLTP